MQAMKLANDFAAQTRDLITKITLLEEEQEESTTDMQKLVKAVTEKATVLEEQTKVLEEKTIALEEKTIVLKKKK